MEIYEEILRAQRKNRLYALATIVKTQGSTARSAGSKMLVLGSGETMGSVGGGIVERRTLEACLLAMKTGEAALNTYSAFEGDGGEAVACSGEVTVFIEPGKPLPYLYLCGCGHVAQSVLPLAKALGYYVVGVDARDISPFRDALAGLDELHLLNHFGELADMELAPGASFVVCSYSHQTDGEILEVVLKRDPGYVGMLGGRPKIRALFGKLLERGVDEQTLARVHAPIGLDLGGETPAEVALSIMAQIQQVRYGGSGRAMSELFKEDMVPL